jgi:hypothetical protein
MPIPIAVGNSVPTEDVASCWPSAAVPEAHTVVVKTWGLLTFQQGALDWSGALCLELVNSMALCTYHIL